MMSFCVDDYAYHANRPLLNRRNNVSLKHPPVVTECLGRRLVSCKHVTVRFDRSATAPIVNDELVVISEFRKIVEPFIVSPYARAFI